jgi:hypothetical protein
MIDAPEIPSNAFRGSQSCRRFWKTPIQADPITSGCQ